ncbi:MAG TPA: hypothetical protein VGG98_09940 [Solirubrobacteraceae bacterium]|jgi:hypothetical protein
MLFDLRGRHRRRAVRMIYVGLALLMGVGFIGFGVGGGVGGGGILNSGSGNEGAGSASFSSQIKKYTKLTQKQPGNVAAWEKLTTAQLHEAGGEAYVANNQLTSKGKELFSQIAHSWNSYIALNPPKPSPELAQQMVRVFGEEGLNQPAAAVAVLQIVVAAKPQNAAFYGALAQYAYKAKNTREGDLAAAKAVSLAPAAQRPRLKTELAALKKNPSGGETFTGTTNGKPYTVKPGPNGTLTGNVPATTSTPAPSPKKK